MRKTNICCILTILIIFSSLTSLDFVFSAENTPSPFVVGTSTFPGTLDPIEACDSDSINVLLQVVEGLYMYNYSSSEMETIPCLASEMGNWSPDFTNLTISLKEGVTFHDGRKLNAFAVKWNFDRLQYWTFGLDIDDDGDLDSNALGTDSKLLFEHNGTTILNRTEIIDEYTIKFCLNLPCVI